jgi:hypothetical protein
MALFEITSHSLVEVTQASFADLKIKERGDLQRLLRTQIEVLGDDLYVLAEEFGDWEESSRRIDLLALDKEANLVVIELKRTKDGGHMDLQAIRYASMISTMTLERAVEIHAAFLEQIGQPSAEAESRILEFLEWESKDDGTFADDVRMLLVSEDFGKELTTAVLWLRDREIDIRCLRLRPYKHDNKIFIDVQQIIPLPEAVEYQVKVREKEQQERRSKTDKHAMHLRFWTQLVALARARGMNHGKRKPCEYHYLGAGSGISGSHFSHVIVKDSAAVDLYIDFGAQRKDKNKEVFDRLQEQQAEIEARFGEPLIWERLEMKRACRIKHPIELGGISSPESQWPTIQEAMVEAMGRLEKALKPALEGLKV